MTTAERLYLAHLTVLNRHTPEQAEPIEPWAAMPDWKRRSLTRRGERFDELTGITSLPERLYAAWTRDFAVAAWAQTSLRTRLFWQETAFEFLRIDREVAA